ncbi:MAG: DUF2339 domain-containing protein [Caldilineaceae bacterium]
MDDFLLAFLCFANILVVLVPIVLSIWAQRKMRALNERLAKLEKQLQAGQFVAVDAQSAQTPAPLAPAPVEQTAPAPMPLPEPVLAPPPTKPISEAVPESPTVSPAPPPARPTPPAPRKPFWEGNPLFAWFARIHVMVQIGVIVLLFGVGFLVKYATDQGWFSLQLRLISAALLGGALVVVGWRVRHRARTYGLALIGGGIGIVYLTTFGAYYFYELLPATLAFGVFVALGVAYAAMALLNDAVILAFLAVIGAFLAPILASDGGGNHVVLFSYYAVVNAGILAIARFKQWRSLNVLSFCFTLAAGVGWGVNSYTDQLFKSTEPFLILFFGFYLTITVWFAQRQKDDEGPVKYGILDTMLLFANPLAAFALQAAMLPQAKFWLAYSALGLAAVYAVLGLLCDRRWRVPSLVTEAFLFLASFFLAISIPLRVDPKVTPAIWAILGAGLVWLGARRQRLWAHGWGIVVHLLAATAFMAEVSDTNLANLRPFTNHIYFSTIILSLAALTGSYILHRNRVHWPKVAPVLTLGLLASGLLWWFGGGYSQIYTYLDQPYWVSSFLTFVALSCLLAEFVGALLDWPALRFTLLGLLPVAALGALELHLGEVTNLFGAGGWYAWPLVLLAHLLMLWRWTDRKWLTIYHAGGVWLLTFVLTAGALWQVDKRFATGIWHTVALLGVPTLVLLGVGPLNRWMPWPLSANPTRYAGVAALPLAIWLVIAATVVSVNDAGASPFARYIPLLNPLDLVIIGLLGVLWLWVLQMKVSSAAWLRALASPVGWAVSLFAFLAANAGIARAIHHLTGAPFDFDALFASATLQTTYAIFWGALALVLMFTAHHRGQRGGWHSVWYTGAAILGLTVLKLFVVDLAQTGTLARIISFMSVGLLIIVIAYFWPAPPRKPMVEASAKI